MPSPTNQTPLARRRARVHAAKQPPDHKGPSRQPAGPANPQSDEASRGFFAWGCDRDAEKQNAGAAGRISDSVIRRLVEMQRRITPEPSGRAFAHCYRKSAVPINQISQSTEFKALRKPPNSLSRQGAVPLAAFRRSEMVVRLISIAFGFGLGRTPAVTFFDL